MSDLRSKRYPWVWTHLVTEAGNDTGIDFVVVQSQELALSEPLDPGGIDNADPVACIVEVRGKLLPVASIQTCA